MSHMYLRYVKIPKFLVLHAITSLYLIISILDFSFTEIRKILVLILSFHIILRAILKGSGIYVMELKVLFGIHIYHLGQSSWTQGHNTYIIPNLRTHH